MIKEDTEQVVEFAVSDKIRKKAHWLLPISRMIERDILSYFDKKPQKLSAVFIGSWSRGLIEANAFRVACKNLDIDCQTVFLIELNSSVLEQSLTSATRQEYQMELDGIQDAQPYVRSGTITFSEQGFQLYDAKDYTQVAGDRHSKPIIFIKGDAGDSYLAKNIVDAVATDSSIVVIGRNVEPGTYSYLNVITTWVEQLGDYSSKGTSCLMAFTATDDLYASRMYADICGGLSRKVSQHIRNVDVLTSEVGVPLHCPPKLLELGANFSDSKLHVVSVRGDMMGPLLQNRR